MDHPPQIQGTYCDRRMRLCEVAPRTWRGRCSLYMKKVELVNGCFYHIYNRGVDKRDIFLESSDYTRFMQYLLECNSLDHITNIKRRVGKNSAKGTILNKIVEIICFILIPNHFHFILRQLVNNGISKFMQKLETGHAMYFNKKYERTGRLYEGHFKPKLIGTDEYMMHLSSYIHLNCIGLIEPDWKEQGVKDWGKANKFLETYKWSSYLDYIGKQNFPDIINKGPLQEYFKTPEGYKKYVQSWKAKDIDILGSEDLIIE